MRSEDCEDPLQEKSSNVSEPVPGKRRSNRCDDSTPIGPADTFAPEAAEPSDPPELLSHLVVGNDTVSLDCASIPGAGSFGDTFVMAENSIPISVGLSYIPDNIRARLVDNEEAVVASALSSDTDTLQSTYGMSKTIASRLVAEVLDAKSRANASAMTQALGSIVCWFENAAVTVTCPEGTMTDGEVNGRPIQNPVVIDAGTFTSRVSQGDADMQAEAEASRRLTCYYASQEVTVTCESAFGITGIVSDTETPPYGTRRIASVTVAAGVYTSSVSQEDAQQQAINAATLGLECFYLSEAQSASCPDIDHIHDAPVSYEDGVSGTDVTIQAGWFASIISQADANEQATVAVTSRLLCEYGNDALTATCETPTVEVDGTSYTLPPDGAKSPTLSILIEANEFRSTISKAAANEEAGISATSALDCVYCNPLIPPTCVPSDILEGVNNGEITLPLSAAQNGWSMDATIGMPYGRICGADAQSVMAQALATSTTPVRIVEQSEGDESCRYGNDEVTFSCPEFAIPLGTLNDPTAQTRKAVISENSITVTTTQVPVDFEPSGNTAARAKSYANWLALQEAKSILSCVFYNEQQVVTCEQHAGKPNVASIAIGSAANPVTIKADTLYSEISRDDANLQAIDEGKRQLDCFYLSRQAVFLCGDAPYESSAHVSTDNVITYGNGKKTPSDGSYNAPSFVDPTAIGSLTRPIVITPGVGRSTETQADADSQVLATAVGMLDCFWTNVPIEIRCGSNRDMPWNNFNEEAGLLVQEGNGSGTIGIPGSLSTPIIINPGLQVSHKSRFDATKQLYDEARASLNCVWGNTALSVACEAENMADGSPSTWDVTAVTSVAMGANMHMSFVSQTDADLLAVEDARGKLSCVYTHNDIEYNGGNAGGGGGGGGGVAIGQPCPGSMIPVGVLKVPKGTFKAMDPNSPKELAIGHINNNQQCASADDVSASPYGWMPIRLGIETPEDEPKIKVVLNQYATLLKGNDYMSDCVTDTAGFSEIHMLGTGDKLVLRVLTNKDGTYKSSEVLVTQSNFTRMWTHTGDPTDPSDMEGVLIVFLAAVLPFGRAGAKSVLKVGDNLYTMPHLAATNFLLEVACDAATGKRHPVLTPYVAGFNPNLA